MSSTSDRQFLEDENGFPILFAVSKTKRLPDTRAELVTPDATSGAAEYGRYHDAVREASRSFDNPQEGDIHQFLQARARHPEKVDVSAFHEAVKRQRTADLVDILDAHMRRSGSLPRGARMVRVQAPKGYVRRALRQSSPEELAHLRHRLNSIGHSQENVDAHLSDRVAPDMWDQATAYEVHMAEGEFEGLTFDDADTGWAEDSFEEPIQEMTEALATAFGKMTFNIYVNSTEATSDGISS